MAPSEKSDEVVKSDSSSGESSQGATENQPPAKRLKTVIPLPNKILMNLQTAHKELQPAHREALIQSCVHYSLTDKEGLSSPGNQYLLKRLITGVSASVGSSRQNYATILMRLTNAHAKFEKKAPVVDVVYAAVVQVYGENGSFKTDYQRGLLDKTLGSLAATSAIVRGARKAKMSLDTARQIVRVLRHTVSGIANKWSLAPAVIGVLRELLDTVRGKSHMQPLAKPLWKWAEERKGTHDGLTLALLMRLEYKMMTEDAFRSLYTSIADLSTPLLAMFDTGFPLDRKIDPDGPEMFIDDLPDVYVSFHDCPLTWALMLKYLATPEGRKHLGGVSTFWNELVTPSLQTRVHNTEKKLLVRSIVSMSIVLCAEDEPQEAVLSSYTLNLCTQIPWGKSHKTLGKTRAVTTLQRLNQLREDCPSELMALCSSNKLSESRRAFLAEYIVRWVAVNTGIGNGKDRDKLVANIPEAVPSSMIDRFFSKLLYCFLCSNAPTQKSLDVSREIFLSVLSRTISEHPDLEPLMIHVCIMASIFCPTTVVPFKTRTRRLGEKIALEPVPASFEITVEQLQNELTTKSFSTKLPAATPQFSDSVAKECFSRLQEVLLKALNARKVADRVKFAVRLLDNCIENAKQLDVKLRSKLSLTLDDSNTPECFKGLRNSVKQLDAAADSATCIHECLALIGGYLQIMFFEPESQQFASLEKLSNLFSEAVNKLTSDSNEEQDTPSALEQTVHLLCCMCDESEHFATVAKSAIGLLGQSAGDSVTAVLFDLLDAARKGETEHDLKEVSEEEEEEDEDDGDEEDDDAFMVIDAGGNGAQAATGKDKADPEEGDADAMKDDAPEKAGDKMEITTPEAEQDTDILDADVDPDTEDPAVLNAFDKHLSNHMKLLTEKRVKTKANKSKKKAKIIRLLKLIESFGNSLRLRVERKNEEVDKKTVAVFFDIFVRLIEFMCSEEFDTSKYAKNVTPICAKLLSRKQVLVDGLAGLDIIGEFASRLFTALTKAHSRGGIMHALSSTIRRLAGIILETHSKSYKQGQDELIKLYKELWDRNLKVKTSFFIGEVFSDFAVAFPEEATALAQTAQKQSVDKERSDAERKHAVKLMEIVQKKTETK